MLLFVYSPAIQKLLVKLPLQENIADCKKIADYKKA